MNGLNSIGGAGSNAPAAGADAAQGSNFDAIFQEGITNTSAVLLQLLGGDIIQSVMKDENAVD